MSKNPFRVHGAARAGIAPAAGGSPLTTGVQRPEAEPATGEQLTGRVQGQTATDLEERVGRAADKQAGVRSYSFNPRLLLGVGLLPPNVSLSYAIYAPVLCPVQVDAAYPLNTGEERAAAQLNDDLLTEFLKTKGAAGRLVTRLSRRDLGSQTQADRALAGVI